MEDRKWIEMYDTFHVSPMSQVMGNMRRGVDMVIDIMSEPEFWLVREREMWTANRANISRDVSLMIQTRLWPAHDTIGAQSAYVL